MSLEDIIKKIKEDGEERIKRIEEEKKEKIRKIKEEGLRMIEEKKNQILANAEKEKKRIIEQAIFELERETKGLILKKKHIFLDHILKEIIKKIAELKKDEYFRILEKIWKKINIKNSQLLRVLISDKRQKEDKEFFENKKILIDGTFPASGGFILKTPDFDIDCSLEKFIQGIYETEQINIINILFN